MCRLAAYLGKNKISLSEIVINQKNSLLKQVVTSSEKKVFINSDGFGFAWYGRGFKEPGLFKSPFPIWNDNNLTNLTKIIYSNCFISHIRASTLTETSWQNCHPFIYKNFSFIHNGEITKFDCFKLEIINFISKDLFLKIRGNTDSEYIFYLIMHFYNITNNIQEATICAIKWLYKVNKTIKSILKINIILSNGKQIIAVKYSNDSDICLGYKSLRDGGFEISSEPLSLDDWIEIDSQSIVTFDTDFLNPKIENLILD